MKRTNSAFAILAGLAAMTGTAWGDEPAPSLPGVTVRQFVPPGVTPSRPLGECTPPTDRPDCEALHRELRAHFTPTQLGMLFGAASSHVQYVTTYNYLRDDYQQFLRDYVAAASSGNNAGEATKTSK